MNKLNDPDFFITGVVEEIDRDMCFLPTNVG